MVHGSLVEQIPRPKHPDTENTRYVPHVPSTLYSNISSGLITTELGAIIHILLNNLPKDVRLGSRGTGAQMPRDARARGKSAPGASGPPRAGLWVVAAAPRLPQRLLHRLPKGQMQDNRKKPGCAVRGMRSGLRGAPVPGRPANALTCGPGSSDAPPLPAGAPPPRAGARRFALRNFVQSAQPSPRPRRCHGGGSAALQGRVSEAVLVSGRCRRRRGP